MNKPPFKTMVLGHPLASLPVYGFSAFMFYHCAIGDAPWFVGAGALAAIAATHAAGERADAYREWKRAWDAMDDNPTPSKARGTTWLGATIIAAALLFFVSQAEPATYRLAFGWLLFLGIAWLAIAIVKRLLRRRTRHAKVATVTVAIARPLMPVPDKVQAYRQLPEHCHLLMRALPHDAGN